MEPPSRNMGQVSYQNVYVQSDEATLLKAWKKNIVKYKKRIGSFEKEFTS